MQTIWFFLPAGIANMSASLSKYIPFLDISISKKYLGKNKTYRGFLFGIIVAILVTYIQYLLYPNIKLIAITNYQNFIFLGFLQGFGALLGDSVESFFKRKKNIPPGKSWFPFDQIDWILGAIILSFLYIKLPISIIIVALIFAMIAHPLINLLGYTLKLQKNKF